MSGPAREGGGLYLHLDRELPAELPAGRGSVLFVHGACFHPTARIASLTVLVDGHEHAVTASGMPRFDVYRSLHPALGDGSEGLPASDPDSVEDPEIRSYRSGFWASVPIGLGGEAGSTLSIALRARLAGGGEEIVEAGRIELAAPPGAVADDPDPGLIAVCMSTYEPDMVLLRRQLESLRGQLDLEWMCVISDDCSRPERYREIEDEVAGDPRFRLVRSERRRGFYRGFERALELAPPEAGLIALCDQDDVWYPEKLSTLRSEIGKAGLVYSDQRLVDEDGTVISETYWSSRANNHTNLLSLLIANTITGAASLIRREIVDLALPFPEVPGEQYHDHWLGLVAMAAGEVAYVDRPLYDYVQHGGATLGHAAANAGVPPRPRIGLRERLRLAGLRRLLGEGRPAYFFGYERLAVLAELLLLRAGDRLSRSKRRALRRFVRVDRRPLIGVPWLLARSLRSRVGRNESLGVESFLASGILWRLALTARARGVERPAGWTYDASVPTPGMSAPDHGEGEVAHIEGRIEPLDLSISEREPERINVLIPTIDLAHLFGGYIAKFNLARRLAEAGHRVRIVTVDPTPPLPDDWRRRVEAFDGLEGALERVEVAFARDESAPLPINPADRFVATTWWTAHLARAAVAETDRERFLYLIQEYEPYTFEMGSLAALAAESYVFPHLALFSTELLRGFFAARGHGVFASGSGRGEEDSISFQNAITPASPASREELAARGSRRLLFYARSEPHARRNMFELGLIALSRAVAGGAFGPDWEFLGVGSVRGRSEVPLPGGAVLRILQRLDQAAYGEMLPDHDVGLSLMYTPHPSLVPIEMASAGLITVTNTCETKTAGDLEAISANLVAAEPTIEGVTAALRAAAGRVSDYDARVAGSAVDWSRDWNDTFDATVMAELQRLLDRC